MNHAELVEKVAQATGMPKAAASGDPVAGLFAADVDITVVRVAHSAVEALVQTIVDAAMAGEEVRVTGWASSMLWPVRLGLGVIHKLANPSIFPPARRCGSCGKSGQRPTATSQGAPKKAKV
jgi:hypothetical protein